MLNCTDNATDASGLKACKVAPDYNDQWRSAVSHRIKWNLTRQILESGKSSIETEELNALVDQYNTLVKPEAHGAHDYRLELNLIKDTVKHKGSLRKSITNLRNDNPEWEF